MKRLLIFSQILILLAGACAKKAPRHGVVKNPDYKKAESFLDRQSESPSYNDSAFYYFNKVVNSSRDSLQIAMAYTNMGTVQSDAGDYFGCQESLLQALKFLHELKKEDRRCLAATYNELGLTSSHLHNYDQALSFYDAALKFSDVKDFKVVILNNKALAYQKKSDYAQALRLYQQILSNTEKNDVEYARVLSNMARTKWLLHPAYKAAPELLIALQLRLENNDLWGQNASYAHLADYYTSSRPDSGLVYARKMYQVACRLLSATDQIEALKKLIQLSPPRDAKRYFVIYQHLDDSIQLARNAAKNQFALIRYEVQKNKADNLRLQRDNTVKKYQIVRQQVFLYCILFVAATGAASSFLWYRKRKRWLYMQTQATIKEHQLKTSQKVHDVVANGLYRIMTEVEHIEAIDKEQLLDKIEVLYEQSRDISYEKEISPEENFHQKVAGLVKSFASEQTKVLVVGNNAELWKNVPLRMISQIEPVLHELMVNMAKHSRASIVAIKFERSKNMMNISYTDNGRGMPVNVPYGNGLRNTGNRIKELNGSISFDAGKEKGLKVQISIPIA